MKRGALPRYAYTRTYTPLYIVSESSMYATINADVETIFGVND